MASISFLKKMVGGKKKDKYTDDVQQPQSGFVVNVQAASPNNKTEANFPDYDRSPGWTNTTATTDQQHGNQKQQQLMSTSNSNNTQQSNDSYKPFGPNTRELVPGIYVPGKPKKKKKSKKQKAKKALEGVYKKTSKGLTPPSYFCSAFTCMCGLICFVSGLTMLILGTSVPTYQVQTSAGHFMRVGGGLFTIIGFVMMLAGFFYFLLVYLRHKGMIEYNKNKLIEKSKPQAESSSDDDDEETKNENKVTKLNATNDSRIHKESTASSDQGITFTARQNSYTSSQSMPVGPSLLAIPPSPSNRYTQRRQSVAIGQGISLGPIGGESSTDPLGRPEQPMIRNQSATNLPTFQHNDGKNLQDPPPFHGLSSKLPPIATGRRGSVAVANDNRTKLTMLEEIVSDAPAESSRLTSRRTSLFQASSAPMDGVDNPAEGNRLTSRRASLFQASDPMAPGSLSTPKILKKTKSAFDFELGSSMANTPRTPMSARKPANDASDVLFQRTNSFDKYTRNK